MFIINLRCNKRHFALLALLVLLLAAMLIATVNAEDGDKCKNGATKEQRLEFLHTYGYECENETFKEITVPDSMQEVYIIYNSIQIEQGFNLENYCGEQVELYTYDVLNYPGEPEVLAHLMVKDGCVIGGDISSARLDGFMHGIINATKKYNIK